jgi:RHS repeat-associated protein
MADKLTQEISKRNKQHKMPLQKIPDYTPVRITWLENAVENSGILEKSGVSDYTLFGSIISERSWSLPDDCNTYTSLYYDNMLDIDCFVDCGTWTTFGSRTYLNCNTSSGYLQIGIYGNYRGAYTEFDTETDSTYVVDVNITGYNTMATWQVSARDNQGNIIASSMVSQTGPMSFEFTATGSVSRVYVMRVTSYYTFASIALSAVSVTGKYHKEDVMYLSYRYGFNNMEKDDELKGSGNSYDFGARIYDSRVGRFLSLDPLWTQYIDWSAYAGFNDNPVVFSDPTGKGGVPKIIYENGKPVKVVVYSKIYVYTDDPNIEVNEAARQIEGEIEFELNRGFNINIRYFKEGARATSRINLPIEFDIEAVGVTMEKAREYAKQNDIEQDWSINFLYVHNKWDFETFGEPVSGYSHVEGGNSGVILLSSIAKTKAHEYLHMLNFSSGIFESKDQTHWPDQQEFYDRLMIGIARMSIWMNPEQGAKQSDISGINSRQSLRENLGFGMSISNRIYSQEDINP